LECAVQSLHNLRQKKDQSFASLGLDVEKLVRLTFPRANDETLEELMLDHFIKAIAHQHVRYKTRLFGPRDMAAAIEETDRIHRIMSSESRDASPVKVAKQPQQIVESKSPKRGKYAVSVDYNLPQGYSAPKFCREVPQSQDVRWSRRNNPCVRFKMRDDQEYRHEYQGRQRESRMPQRNNHERRRSWRSQSPNSQERNDSPFDPYRSRSNSRDHLNGRGSSRM
jgi:hypothetical protein